MKRKQLQERLVNFAVLVIGITQSMPKSITGKHFAGQLLRSGSAPALHYGESQSAESRKDFIHKMSIALKELRETHVNLIIIQRTECHKNKTMVTKAIQECDELISIFVSSIQTVKKRDL